MTPQEKLFEYVIKKREQLLKDGATDHGLSLLGYKITGIYNDLLDIANGKKNFVDWSSFEEKEPIKSNSFFDRFRKHKK